MISKAQITVSVFVIFGISFLNGYPKPDHNLKLRSFRSVSESFSSADLNVPKDIDSLANIDVKPSGPVLKEEQEFSESSHKRRREVPVSAYGRFDPEDSTGSAETMTTEEDVKTDTTESTTSRMTSITKHTSVTQSEKKTQKPEVQKLTTEKPVTSPAPASTSVASTTKKLFQFEIPKIIPQAPPLNFGFGIGR